MRRRRPREGAVASGVAERGRVAMPAWTLLAGVTKGKALGVCLQCRAVGVAVENVEV